MNTSNAQNRDLCIEPQIKNLDLCSFWLDFFLDLCYTNKNIADRS